MAVPHPLRRISRRLVAGAAPVALVLAAAGCGVSTGEGTRAMATDPGTPTSAGDRPAASTPAPPVVPEEGSFEGTGGAVFLREAATATAEVTSQKLAMTMSMGGAALGGDLEITYAGEFDNEAGLARLEMDLGSMGGLLGEGAGRMEMVVDGDTVYIRSDLFATGDKPWVKVTADELEVDGAMTGVQGDPDSFLRFLEGVSDDVEEVGREDQRGVSTTHLRATLDLARLLEEADEAEAADLEADLESLGAAGEAFTNVPVDAWIDDDGYVRRFRMSFDLSGVTSESGVSGDAAMVIDLELYDFGVPVTIEVPDPSQVGELDGLGGFGG